MLILSQDSFYRHHDEEEIALAFANELDFDHPSAIDFGLFKEVLEELRLGNSVEVSPGRPRVWRDDGKLTFGLVRLGLDL